MKPRTQFYLGFTLLFAAAAAYLFSLYPEPDTPEYVYQFAPVAAVGAIGLIVSWLLYLWRPDLACFKRREAQASPDVVLRLMWRGRRAAGHWLACLGGAVGLFVVEWPDFQRAPAWIVFVGIVMMLDMAAVGAAQLLLTSPRAAGRALLTVAGLFCVVALAVPLFRFDGPGWLMAGFHPAYFLFGAAALAGSASLLAFREAGHGAATYPSVRHSVG